MIRIVVDRVFSGDLHYQEMFGLSTDTKPTEGLITGSKFTETDTGDVYLLEEGENAEWHKSAEGPGSGGGGGGGATVKVVKFTLADIEEGVYTTVSCDATCEEIIAAVNDDNTIVKAIASLENFDGIAVRAEIDMCGTYYNMKAVVASIPDSNINTFGKAIYLRGLDDEWSDVTE